MLCKSCNQEVSPKFSHAISTNSCPFCGKNIIDEELQLILISLQDSMNSILKYPNEILDWLKSNYDLIPENQLNQQLQQQREDFFNQLNEQKLNFAKELKNEKDAYLVQLQIQDDKFKEFQASIEAKLADLPKDSKTKKTIVTEEMIDKDGNQIAGEPLTDQSTVNQFMKNAGIKNPMKSNDYKKMVSEIKKNGESNALTLDDVQALDEEESEQLHSILNSNISSGLDSDYDEEIPLVVQQMANQASKNSSTYNQRDILKLQQMHQKSRVASRELSEGGSVGVIRR